MVARDVASDRDDGRIYPALLAFIAHYRSRPELFQSFAVVFENTGRLSEEAFEAALWARMQSLSDRDSGLGHTHDPRVAADPDDPHFSMSLGGEGFFIVGLAIPAPAARRGASRRRPWCSTCTTSSSGCARRGATSVCANRSSSATSPGPAPRTRCWPSTASAPPPASSAAGRSRRIGSAPIGAGPAPGLRRAADRRRPAPGRLPGGQMEG